MKCTYIMFCLFLISQCHVVLGTTRINLNVGIIVLLIWPSAYGLIMMSVETFLEWRCIN